MSFSDHRPQTLEVEDAEQRQKRLQAILERLNGGEGPSTGESPNLSFDFGDRRTFAMEPPTELLVRVRQFLPEIERANAELSQMDPRSVDIEHIEETDERIIEMDLGLGVFEERRGARRRSMSSSSSDSETSAASASRSRATRDSSSSSGSDSSSSSSSSDSEDDEDRDGSSRNARSIHPLPRRANARIQILASRDEEESSVGDHPVS